MKDEKKEIKEEIIILDKGIKNEDIIGPQWACCHGPFMPIRVG